MTHPTYANVADEEQGALFETKLERQWREFHEANPAVFGVFEMLTLEAINDGVKVGAKEVWERMRWHFKFSARGTGPKLNNTLVAYYSRHFHAVHPEHAGYFRVRKVKQQAADGAAKI